jgi:hypothetical protein
MRAVDDLCAAAVCVQRVCDLWSVRTEKPAKKEIHTPGELQCPCKKKREEEVRRLPPAGDLLVGRN